MGTEWRGSYDVFMKTIHTAGYRALLAWLRKQRLARGLSMRELAGRLGIAHSWMVDGWWLVEKAPRLTRTRRNNISHDMKQIVSRGEMIIIVS